MLPAPWTFHLSGGRLCLDFANTVSWRAGGRSVDRLAEAADLVRWARQARVVTECEAAEFAAAAREGPGRAASTLRRARRLREATYRVFAAIADRRAPRDADLGQINRALSEASRHARVARRADGRFAWRWADGPPQLDRILWPVARSAAEVLTGDDLGRIKKCPASNCGWIFLDLTRSATRRWCAMTVCGNRAKARRFYARSR
jgi:predicted RNA-binding Zn ribbon-like protein